MRLSTRTRPWRYERPTSDRRDIENQYPTMALAHICEALRPAGGQIGWPSSFGRAGDVGTGRRPDNSFGFVREIYNSHIYVSGPWYAGERK